MLVGEKSVELPESNDQVNASLSANKRLRVDDFGDQSDEVEGATRP
jgi:hypothetical protein